MALIYCAKKGGNWTNVTKKEYDNKKALGQPTKLADKGKNCDGSSLTPKPSATPAVSSRPPVPTPGVSSRPPVTTPPAPASCSYPSTPFADREEGDEFRKWMHEKHKDWAVDNNLDISYPSFNNCKYMRKAYYKFGKEYEETGHSSGTQNGGTGTITAENQKEFFDKLITSGRIYDGFLIQIAPDVMDKIGKNLYEWTYIKKYNIERDTTGKIVKIGDPIPISSKADITYSDTTLYTLLFYDFVWGYLMKRGEVEMANHKLTWEAGAPVVSFKESRRRRNIVEQNIKFDVLLGGGNNNQSIFNPGGSPSSQGSSSTGIGSTTTSQGSQGPQSNTTVTTGGNPSPQEVKKVIDPIKNEALGILEGLKGFANTIGKGKEIQQAIDLLTSVDSSKACEKENVDKINQGKSQIDGIINDNKTALVFAPKVKNDLEKLKVLLDKVITECERLKKMASTNVSTQGSTGTQGSQPVLTQTQTGRKEDLRKMFGFVNPDGTTYNPAVKVKKMEKDPTRGEYGKGSIQNAIENSGARSYYFDEYNELMKLEGLTEFVLKFPENFPEESYAGQVIDAENASGLLPLEDQPSMGQLTKETFGNYLGTTSKMEIVINKGQSSTVENSEVKCPYDAATARTKLIQYLTSALKADRKTKPNMNQKKEFCACYKSGKFSDFEKIKSDELSGVSDELQPLNKIFNRKLSWKEIKKLMQGEVVSGIELLAQFVDRDFGTGNCLSTMSESLRSNIKKTITEAIKNKKKKVIKESVVSRVLSEIKRKTY
jgi:hypothetical protein